MRRLRPAGVLIVAAGGFTLAWAIGCGIIGASLQTDGGTFAAPVTKDTSNGR